MICIRCNHGTAKWFGPRGKAHIQMYRCDACHATFSAPPLGRHHLDTDKATSVIALVTEKDERTRHSGSTGVHKSTIFPHAHGG